MASMIPVRTVRLLKALPSLDEAQKYAHKIQHGGGRNSYFDLEIHWNPKPKPKGSLGGIGAGASAILAQQSDDEPETEGPWEVVVVNEQTPPGAKPCAECETPFFGDDYLCDECRKANEY